MLLLIFVVLMLAAFSNNNNFHRARVTVVQLSDGCKEWENILEYLSGNSITSDNSLYSYDHHH